MEYVLDSAAAKKADQFFSRIEEKGKYLGVLTRAEAVVSTQGTKGVDFSFKAEDGSTADYLQIWTQRADGSVIDNGHRILMAIMTCLRVKSLKAVPGEIEKYDFDLQQRIKVKAELFNELMNKPIGLLIHMEEYEKKAGGTGWKPAISAPFDKDGFTASEILSQAKQAATLEKMVASLKDRPLKNKPAGNNQSGGQQSGGTFDSLPDEIPF